MTRNRIVPDTDDRHKIEDENVYQPYYRLLAFDMHRTDRKGKIERSCELLAVTQNIT